MNVVEIAEALAKKPLPWRVDRAEFLGEEYCNGIEDANGDSVVCTDSGVYPPSLPVADMIVEAVNGRAEIVAALRWAMKNPAVCRCIGRGVCHGHQALAKVDRAGKPIEKKEPPPKRARTFEEEYLLQTGKEWRPEGMK